MNDLGECKEEYINDIGLILIIMIMLVKNIPTAHGGSVSHSTGKYIRLDCGGQVIYDRSRDPYYQ